MNMINIKINNTEYQVQSGMTILEAAQELGIKIPTLCHYPDLKINSDCRICSVEVKGKKNLLTACSTPVVEGMEIRTHSTKVLNARKTITELILTNHETNCTQCARNLNCELQTLSNQLGIDENRFEYMLKPEPKDTFNPSLTRDANLCIKCGRCIDICKEVQDLTVLENFGRSSTVRVVPKYGKYFSDDDCTLCGQCSAV